LKAAAAWPFNSSTVYFATEAVSHPHRSDRSFEKDLNPVVRHHRLTETWQSGDWATEGLISYFGSFGR
jgi:hypothetical protein